MHELKNKIAVVTGAGSGIGQAIALGLAAAGANTFLLGRSQANLKAVVRTSQKTAARSRFFTVDLSSLQELRSVADRLKKETERIDILVHSAGIISLGPLSSAAVEDFDRQYKINVRAPFALTQCLLPMIEACQGQVVFINSSAGLNAAATVGQYAATKFGLKAIADSFRQEINAHGVRVLSVYPGRTASPMQASIYKMEGRPYRPERLMQPVDVAEVVIHSLQLPRSAEVTDIHVRPFVKS